MATIRDRHGHQDIGHDVRRETRHADGELKEALKAILRDRTDVAALARVDVKELSVEAQQLVARFMAQELRGQLPQQVLQALVAGQVGVDQLQSLLDRFMRAQSPDGQRFGQATTPDQARSQASDTSAPQQALRWTQFVQRALLVPGGAMTQGRAGSAAPKGEGATLAELIGARSAGLKNPKLVERGIADLSPGQRALLMKASFGEAMAHRLQSLGITDPLQFVKAGAMPQDRAALAEALAMDRGKLLGLLMRAELLKIGPGKNGEMGIRPDLLGPLQHAGIAMLGTLAALRGVPRDEMSFLYGLLRKAAGGFENAIKGSRPPVKRDLLHWAKQAGRKPSDILLADDLAERKMSRGDAQELIAAWYLENLLWDALASAKQGEHRRVERTGDEEEKREGQDGGAPEQDQQSHDDGLPNLDFDHGRDDQLICFWITDFNTDPTVHGSMRRMYVCIDPSSGAILPQQIEADKLPKG